MRRVIVGTAGHIDHGKTKLVEAITGIDCDRWEEERQRGITIDLGFAHLTRDDLQIGFIDVPGHERFLHNALAGLGGIRILLLVVAADEGIKPQTLEHVEICSLLGIPRAVVALTKIDLVSEDLIELARLEIEELLQSSPWPEAEILPVSAVSNKGLEELLDRLVAQVALLPEETISDDPLRLPIDRAFQFRGLGSIVTGTLAAGSVAGGDTLEVMPSGQRAKVRSVQVHGEERPLAVAGERTALQLSGVSLSELDRGQQLTRIGAFQPSSSLLVELELLPNAPAALTGSTPIRFHLLSSEVVGRLRPLEAETIEPGQTAIAQIRLAAPVVAVRGDRFVVRRPSPPTTLGGGTVLDPWWRQRRGARLRRAVGALTTSEEKAIRLWVDDSGLHGLIATGVAQRLGINEADAATRLGRLAEAEQLLKIDPGHGRPQRWIAPERLSALGPKIKRLLGDYLKKERLAAGMPKAEVLRRLLPGVSADLARLYLERLEARKLLVVQGDVLTLPGREAAMTSEESGLAAQLIALYEQAGLTPPPPSEAARTTGSKPQIVDGVIHYLIQQGKLVKIGGGLVIAHDALRSLRDDLLASGLDEFTVAQFRDRYGLTRKWAIPILEHFDTRRVTHRIGDVRKLVLPRDQDR